MPLVVRYRADGRSRRIVLTRIRKTGFGLERSDDRAAAAWLKYHTYNELPHHQLALDLAARMESGRVRSIGGVRELLLVTSYVPGAPYAQDLQRVAESGSALSIDLDRSRALAEYLGRIHREKQRNDMLWRRRLRDLVGHGTGVMGIVEGFPADVPYTSLGELQLLERAVNYWRWRLMRSGHRLSQVHGDFNPNNIVFLKSGRMRVLGRGSGGWGEPAEDLACMSVHYLYFAVRSGSMLRGDLQGLYHRFWTRYMELLPDPELFQIIQPWLAWRAMELANPVLFPETADSVRRALLGFARRVLAAKRYDFRNPNRYLEDGQGL
jgi:hypothetical protein